VGITKVERARLRLDPGLGFAAKTIRINKMQLDFGWLPTEIAHVGSRAIEAAQTGARSRS
jgi:hypothetical protein